MKRWAIAAVVVVGVALGILLMPRPDTGGAIGDRAGAKLDGPGFQAPTDNDPKNVATPTPGSPTAEAVPAEPLLSQEQRDAITAQLSTPEANAARQVNSGWSRVRMGLSAHRGDAEADALLAEVEGVLGELRGMRRASTKEGWDALEKKQRDLLARVQASPYGKDDNVTAGAGSVTDKLDKYDNGTLEIMKVGPSEGGPDHTADPAVIESSMSKSRPR